MARGSSPSWLASSVVTRALRQHYERQIQVTTSIPIDIWPKSGERFAGACRAVRNGAGVDALSKVSQRES